MPQMHPFNWIIMMMMSILVLMFFSLMIYYTNSYYLIDFAEVNIPKSIMFWEW